MNDQIFSERFGSRTDDIADRIVAFPLNAWPFELAKSRDRLADDFVRLLGGAEFVDTVALTLPKTAFGSDGLATFRLTSGVIIIAKLSASSEEPSYPSFYELRIDEATSEFWNSFVDSLRIRSPLEPDAIEIRVARAVASVYFGGVRPSKAAGRVVQDISVARQVWTAPVSGLEWVGAPLEFSGVAVVGSLSGAFLESREVLCRDWGIQAELDYGAVLSWSEDFFGELEEAAATGEPLESFLPDQGPDDTLIIAVSTSASTRSNPWGRRRVEALVGAILLDLDSSVASQLLESIQKSPSWFVGYLADEVRVEDMGEEATMTARLVLSADQVAAHLGCFISLLEIMSDESDVTIESACLHWYSAVTALSPEVAILHCVIALECLSQTVEPDSATRAANSTESAAIRARLASYVVSRLTDRSLALSVLEIYDLRSEFVHTGCISANGQYVLESAELATSILRQLLKQRLSRESA